MESSIVGITLEFAVTLVLKSSQPDHFKIKEKDCCPILSIKSLQFTQPIMIG